MTEEIRRNLVDIDGFGVFTKRSNLNGISSHVSNNFSHSAHKFRVSASSCSKGAHGVADGGTVCHFEVDNLVINHIIVTVIYASAIWTVLNGLGHTFDGRVKSKDVDGPLGVSVFNADLRIFEVDFFSVKRTMIFGFAAVQATKSGALRSTLRFKQIGVAKRRHGFTGFTGEPEK